MSIKSIIVASTLAACHLVSAASPVVNQLNTSNSLGSFCGFSTDSLCGQSFVQSGTIIAGAGFRASGYSGSNVNVTVSIYGNYSATPSNLIASGSYSGLAGPTGWIDVFWTPAALTTGATYYMVLSSQDYIVANYTTTASYLAGNALFGGNATGWSSYDLAFRTFSESASAAVPEPMSAGLLGIGLLGLCLARRKAA